MEKFINYAKKYNLQDLFFIFLVSLFLFIFFYAKQDAYLVDVGREAYIPWQMLQGKVLYKDIFNVYGPLGYQINAIAYMIFGVNLNTLYLMGFLNSLIVCFTTYYTVKLFSSRRIALCATALTLAVCVYIRTFFNFIFAYSYSALYALSGFLLSLFFALFYIKEKSFKYLIISFLCAGFSFANKIEDIPYFIFLFLCLPFFTGFEKDWKKYLYALCAFFVFPVISFGILLLQGISVDNLLSAYKYVIGLIKAPATEYFYNAYGLYFNPFYIQLSFVYLFKLLKTVLPFALLFYVLNFLNKKFIENSFLKKILNCSVVFFILFAVFSTYKKAAAINVKVFCWVGLCAVLVLIGFFAFYFIKLLINKRNNGCINLTFIKADDWMFLFLLVSAILVSLKGIWGISTECYGTFTLAALFMPFVVFFAKYLALIKQVDRETLEKTIQNLCVVILLSYFFVNAVKIGEKPLYPVVTDRGTIMVRSVFKSQNEFIKFIKANTPVDAKIVSVPEGAIINFLSERNSDNFYYYLIPVNVQVFGEKKILADFKKNMPDYFIMNNVPYTPFNVGNFCSYASKICDFIEKEYIPMAGVNDGVEFVLYKKKPVVK